PEGCGGSAVERRRPEVADAPDERVGVHRLRSRWVKVCEVSETDWFVVCPESRAAMKEIPAVRRSVGRAGPRIAGVLVYGDLQPAQRRRSSAALQVFKRLALILHAG